MKYIISLFIVFLLLFIPINVESNNINNMTNNKTINENFYKDALILLIYPQIENAINDFYEDYLTTPPDEDLYSIKILSIKKVSNIEYIIKVEVNPYVGAHNTIARDHITIKIPYKKAPVVLEYKHLESKHLPEHLKSLIIKWPPKTN